MLRNVIYLQNGVGKGLQIILDRQPTICVFYCLVGGVSLAYKLRGLSAENFGRLLAAVFSAVQVCLILHFHFQLNRVFLKWDDYAL